MSLTSSPSSDITTPITVLETPPSGSTMKAGRLASLDIFRGITIASMVLVNNPGNWSKIYAPLGHADWHGWTPTDLVFPFFLFIVGVATPFSFAKRLASTSKRELLGHVWSRALALFMLGQLLTAIPTPSREAVPDGFVVLKVLRWTAAMFCWIALFALLTPWPWKRLSAWLPVAVCVAFYGLCVAMHFANERAVAAGLPAKFVSGGIFNPDFMRIPGVLQRIGICYGVAASIALFAGWRTILVSAIVLCAAYSALMLGVKLRDDLPRGSLTQKDNVARTVDEFVLDRYTLDAKGERQYRYRHAYRAYPDNEGIVSTVPAIATTLFGVLVGLWLRSARPAVDRAAGLLAMAVPVTIVGVLLDWWLMPINKNLWTPSFAVFTAGLAMLGLGVTFWLADVHGRRAWAWPFKVFGMNAIAAFVASGFISKVNGMIVFTDRWTNVSTSPLGWLKTRINAGVTHGSAYTSHWHLPAWDTPENLSLAYALAFVLIVFALMALMYVCRVFVKV